MLTQEEPPDGEAMDVEDIAEEWSDRRTKKVADYFQRAIHHLRIAIDSSPNEIFLQLFVHLLENSSNLTEAKSALESFRDSNEENPIAHRMLFEFLRRVDPFGTEWKKPAHSYLLLDPRSAPNIVLIPYINHLKKLILDGPSTHERRQIFEDIIEILIWRVEHGDFEKYTINSLAFFLAMWREVDDRMYDGKWLDRISDFSRCKHFPLQLLMACYK